jgi:long-chain acyl-CoA synthetase
MDATRSDVKTPPPPAGALTNARTLPELFEARVALTPDAVAYRQFDPRASAWLDWTWRQVGAEVERWRAALAREDFAVGARVATLMANSVAYVCVDQAALSLGLAIVPLHVTDNPGNLAYIIEDSAAAALVTDNPAYWARLAPDVAGHEELKRVVVVADEEGEHRAAIALDARAVRAARWLKAAEGCAAARVSLAPEALAAIVYTSGTTGRPKGVMLSHGNVVANVAAVLQCVEAAPDDLYLSFLPLSHTFERTAGYYVPVASGGTVAFARSIAFLSEDMRAVRPTILISVPRVYERVHLRIEEALARQGAAARYLSRLAERVGWRRFLASQGRLRGWTLTDRLAWVALDRLVAAKVRAAFGGRLRVAVAGGAPMPPAISRFFLAMGVNVLQGYGMTEASPVVAANRLERNDPESVGETIPGVEVRIGANDEVLVRGPSVMRGYWRRPDDTERALGPDGWLHTGDQARLEGGRLYIKGRIKDIIVTSTGEKISPVDIEQAIGADPLFEQALVVGEQRPFIAALAVVSRARLEEEAKALGLAGPPEQVLTSEAVRALALARIKRAVAHFPDYATPRKAWLTLEPWTIGAGLMTPTLKLKRQAIEGAFAEEIASLYAK